MGPKWTKGKWEYSPGDNNSVDIVLPNEATITIDRSSRHKGNHVMSREEMEANALLIPKASEMIEFIQSITRVRSVPDSYRKIAEQLYKEATENN